MAPKPLKATKSDFKSLLASGRARLIGTQEKFHIEVDLYDEITGELVTEKLEYNQNYEAIVRRIAALDAEIAALGVHADYLKEVEKEAKKLPVS